ncbi:Histone deacetylase 6, partial [Papilio xuthus]
PPQQQRRSAGESKKCTPPSNILTRNGARKAKIQTRAMSAGAKPSAVVIAAKKKNFKKKQTIDTLLKDFYQIAMDSKLKVKGPTGLVTEPRMAEHRCLWDDNYPECPERLIEVLQRCRELNLIEQCKQFAPRAATKEELFTLHSPSVYETLEATHQNNNIEYLEEVSSKYDAIYIHPSTHELALLAAGSTIDMVDRIVSGEVQNGAALIRPPGHHAMRSEPCGYCFYNNVALAAKHAIDNKGLSRILIVDWDVHHGQATQQMFYEDDRVVYFSIHRYEHGTFWPNLRQSDFNYVGEGRGKGYNFNVPLNKTGLGDADYLAIWHQLLMPMALEYQPELIIISAGYDAAIGCPEYQPQLLIVSAGFDSALGDEKGEMQVSPACYASLLHLLMCVCPALCVVLEGGYCLSSLAEGAALTLRTLLGHPPPMLMETGEPSDSIRESILNCIYVQKPYWRCFKYQPTYHVGNVLDISGEEKQKHIVVHKWEGDETRPDKFATRDCYPIQDAETKRKNEDRLNHLRIVTDLSLPLHAVCYIYDEAMLKHKNICEPDHVECPERIMRIHERLRDFGLLQRLHPLSARTAADHEILAVHTQSHLDSYLFQSSPPLANVTVSVMVKIKKTRITKVYSLSMYGNQ